MSEATAPSPDHSPTILQGEDTDSVDSNESTSTKQNGSELSLDVIFEALKNERRRLVLESLESGGDTLDLGTIAEQIAAVENEKSESEITYAERKRVYVALYQCHLPKLDEMGIVEFNKSRGTIREGVGIEPLRPYLTQSSGSRPWHRYYAGIVGVGAGIYGGSQLLGLMSPLTAHFVLLMVLAAVAVCTALHVRSVR